jgi:hypothetical protein
MIPLKSVTRIVALRSRPFSREPGQIHPGPDAQLAEGVPQVGVDRFRRQKQLGGGLFPVGPEPCAETSLLYAPPASHHPTM